MEEKRVLKNLENWAKRVTNGYNGVNVRDMSSSWRDGLAFCAIIHHYRPDLIDFESLSKENIFHNNSLAFSTAEKQLGVPALLDADDMVNCRSLDRLSIITYLFQLYNCFENQNRVNKMRPPVKRVLKEGQSGPPSKASLTEPRSSVMMANKDVCQVCKHRVFILERLMVDGKLYHRTCFKCNKCNSLLKPGAYVESDTAGFYECAICPKDEYSHEHETLVLQAKQDTQSECEISVCNSTLMNPGLSILSSPLSSARNTFLQKSISSETNNEKTNVSIAPAEVNGHSPFSSSHGHNSSDNICENKDTKIVPNVADISSSYALKSDEKSPSPTTQTPSQSLFSREISQMTALKPLNIPSSRSTERRKSSDSGSSAGIKTPTSAKISNFNIPVIKSSTYTSPLSLPRPNSATNLYSKQISGVKLSYRLEKGNSVGNLNDVIHDRWSRAYNRRTSLDTDRKAGYFSHQNSIESESTLSSCQEMQTDSSASLNRLSESKSESLNTHSTPHGPICNSLKNDSDSQSNNNKSTDEDMDYEQHSVSIVKHLIQQKEAEIALNSYSVSKFDDTDCNQKLPTSFKTSDSNIEKSFEKTELKSKKSLSPLLNRIHSNESNFPETKLNDSIDSELDSSVNTRLDNSIDTRFNDSINSSNSVGAKLDSSVDEGYSENEKSLSLEEAHDTSDVGNDVNNKVSSEITEERLPTLNTVNEICDKYETEDFNTDVRVEKETSAKSSDVKEEKTDIMYPDELNPFGDDDDDNDSNTVANKVSESYPDDLNPFGESDEETTIATPKQADIDYDESKNPFASDDEEEDNKVTLSSPPALSKCNGKFSEPKLSQSSINSSPSGSLKGTLKKRRAPKPPLADIFLNSTLNSNSETSPVHSSLSPSKFVAKTPSPKLLKNKPAPPPPPVIQKDSDTNTSDQVATGKRMKEIDNLKLKSSDSSINSVSKANDNTQWKKKKRPAPPVPIPPRRAIKKIPLKEIQSEMKEIEEKQNELEKQGRELEFLIRERDKDEEPTLEEEECIMQLFELVNQKNALFRRQAELMYIKRSQRLEEEQVELEFQIRCLMQKPASQKTDEDKKKEDQLVQRLLDVVDQRNEIVDSIEMDRRREIEEDVSVQEQMEIKNCDLPITAEIKEKSAQKKKKHKEKKSKKKGHEESKLESDENKKETLHRKKKWF